jgi:murein DD-endopeptidase MepM/ murein hydrolase activator NlpD
MVILLILFGLIGAGLGRTEVAAQSQDWMTEQNSIAGTLFSYQYPSDWTPDLSRCSDTADTRNCVRTEFLSGDKLVSAYAELSDTQPLTLVGYTGQRAVKPADVAALHAVYTAIIMDDPETPLLGMTTYIPANIDAAQAEALVDTLDQIVETIQIEDTNVASLQEVWTPPDDVPQFIEPASGTSIGIPTSGIVTQLFAETANSQWYSPGNYYDQNNQLQGLGIGFHHGTDIAAGNCIAGATPIYASMGGRVVLARYMGNGYGTQIGIAHGHNIDGNGFHTYTFYAHMGLYGDPAEYRTVNEGDTVSAGQLIGYQGNDGFTSGSCSPNPGTHLDWEIRVSSSELATPANRFDAVAASPNFYTAYQLTRGDSNSMLWQWIEPGPFTTDPSPEYSIGENSSRQNLFQDAYNRKGGESTIGTPINAAHWWENNGVVIQDFRNGSASDAAIIHDEPNDTPAGTIPAFVVWGAIWQEYINRGGPSELGPPTSDEFLNANNQAQNNFGKGYIVYNPTSYTPWPSTFTNWKVEYFNGYYRQRALTGWPTYVADEGGSTSIVRDWGRGAPYEGKAGIWSDHFAVRYTRSVPLDAGTYRFRSVSDDGVRLIIDGHTLIDAFTDGDEVVHEVTFEAPESRSYDIRLEYIEIAGEASLDFSWESTSYALGEGSSRQALFEQTYQRKGGEPILGTPINEAHWWGADTPIVIQDFRGGTVSESAIIHDEMNDQPAETIPAFAVQGGIWKAYVERQGPDGLGPPTTDEFLNTDNLAQQHFGEGVIVYDNGTTTFTPWPDTFSNWKAEYFNGYYQERQITGWPGYVTDEGTAEGLSFNWGTDAPFDGAAGIWPDNFAARYTRAVALESGTYRFTIDSDDGTRLFIDGDMLINHFVPSDNTPLTVEFVAPETRSYDIQLEYLEIAGEADLQFSWERIGDAGQSDCTDRATFVSETIPDGTSFQGGAEFVKTWRVRNSGTCAWNATYHLTFRDGVQMGSTSSVSFPIAAPGDEVELTVPMAAPSVVGVHRGDWQLVNTHGEPFGSLWVEIQVAGSGDSGVLLGHAPSNTSNAYWNAYDQLIIEYAGQYNLPPALVKAVLAHETGGLGIYGGIPHRAYLYEPVTIDYWYLQPKVRSGTLDQERSAYLQPDNPASPEDMPYGFRSTSQVHIPHGTSARTMGAYYTNITDMLDQYRTDRHIAAADDFTAQYRIAASYGLGQVVYFWHYEKLNGSRPESLYEPGPAIQNSCKVLSDYRDAVASHLGAGNTNFADWHSVLLKYNGGGRLAYVDDVGEYYPHTQPVNSTQLAQHTASLDATAVQSTLAETQNLSNTNGLAVDSLLADLKGEGTMQLVELHRTQSVSGTNLFDGRMRIFMDANGVAVEWESPPVKYTSGVGILQLSTDTGTGYPIITMLWGSGTHSTVGQVVRWNGTTFEPVKILDRDGMDMGTTFVGDRGIIVHEDLTVTVGQRGSAAFDESIVDTYQVDGNTATISETIHHDTRSDLRLSLSDQLEAGGTLTVTLDVINEGSGQATAFHVGNRDQGGVYVDELAAGDVEAVTLTFTITNSEPLTITADMFNTQYEVDETNNSITLDVENPDAPDPAQRVFLPLIKR